MTTSPRTTAGAAPEPATHPLVQELQRVHDVLRADLRACQALARSARDGVPAEELLGAVEQLATRSPHLRLGVDCVRFCGLVHSHHGGEDRTLFPAVRRSAPWLAPVVDRLEEDHRQVSRLLDRIEAAVGRLDEPGGTSRVVEALDALAEHLLAHLTLEEESLRPFLLSLDDWPAADTQDRA